MITAGPPQNVLTGPILDEAPFPDVLVAKAYSPDGETLDLVLYPGKTEGKFELGFARLKAGESYRVEGANGGEMVADKEGKATMEVELKGRTEVRVVRG